MLAIDFPGYYSMLVDILRDATKLRLDILPKSAVFAEVSASANFFLFGKNLVRPIFFIKFVFDEILPISPKFD